MRTPLVAGNWKMNLLREGARSLAAGVRERTSGVAGVEVLVCPPFPYLFDVRDAVAGSAVQVGAQNLYQAEQGAFTGEVSVTQVAEAATHVLIGHSERRQYFGETDESVNLKLKAALEHGLRPVMCVGETLAQRQAEQTRDVLVRQVREGTDGLAADGELIVAYEPVWAIGTGLAANGEIAQDAIGLIRETLRASFASAAEEMRILYGGSVTPENIAEFMARADIDGGLVGGASLKADMFAAIVAGAAAVVATRA